MSAYGDKSVEEAMGIIERYLHAHHGRTGNTVDLLKLRDELKALRDQRIKEDFQSVFGTLSAKSLENCLKAIEEISTTKDEPIAQGKPHSMKLGKR